MIIDSYELFRVTRNANTSATRMRPTTLLALIESGCAICRFAPIVRSKCWPA